MRSPRLDRGRTYRLPQFISAPILETTYPLREIRPSLSSVEWWVSVTCFALVYYVLGRICLLFTMPVELAAPVWAPAGLAIIATLQWGYTVWPAILLGSFFLDMSFLHAHYAHYPLFDLILLSFTVGVGDVIESFIAVYLFRKWAGDLSPIATPRALFRFICASVLGAIFVSTLVVGATALTALPHTSPVLLDVWWTWLLGDFLGFIVMGPLFYILFLGRWRMSSWKTHASLLGFLAIETAVAVIIFSQPLGRAHYFLSYVFLALILWSAFRQGLESVAGSTFVIALVAIWATGSGIGPFVHPDLSPRESVFVLDLFIAAIAIIGLAISSTLNDRRLISERMRQFKFVCDHAQEPYFITNDQMKFIYVNEWACAELGYTPSEFASLSITDINPQMPRWRSSAILERMKNGEYIPPFESIHLRKDGSEYPTEVTLSGYYIDGRFFVLTIPRDITKQKQIEHEMAKRAEELKSKNLELEHFTSRVSHDLKAPLRCVTSYLQLAERTGIDLEAQTKSYVVSAMEHSKKMASLIDCLLQYSTIGFGEKPLENHSLRQIVDSVVHALDPEIRLAEAEIKIESLPTAFVNREQMELVFQNLILNALKFRGKEKPRITIRSEENENDGITCVEDNGLGIPSSECHRIFDPFYRGHSHHGIPGFGIGLATCKKIVEHHLGRIWVESTVSAGSRFFIALPKQLRNRPPAPSWAS